MGLLIHSSYGKYKEMQQWRVSWDKHYITLTLSLCHILVNGYN